MHRALFLVAAVIAPCAAQDRVAPEKVPVLLIGGANNHDWNWTTPSLAKILEETGRFAVTITTEPATALADAEGLQAYRAFVLDYNGERWGEPAESNFVAAVRGGTGVTVIHAANNAFPGWSEFEEIVALLWRDGTGHGRFHPFAVRITDSDHPITAGMSDLSMHPDELYHRLVNTQNTDVRVLASAFSDPKTGGTGNDEPMIMVKQYGAGRVFHTPLGHVWTNVPASRASHSDPQFRRLVARGTEWAATGSVSLEPTPPNWLSPEERALGFELLFDGRSNAGWRAYRGEAFPEQGWVVESGCLHHLANGDGGDIVSEKMYGDFELRFEWAVQKRANSGVIYRALETERSSYMTGPEYQVFDDVGHELAADSNTSAGALYALAQPQKKSLHPAGTFNRGRIVVRGWHIEHWLNDTKIVDVDLATPEMQQRIAGSKFAEWPQFAKSTRGHVVLQDHGNEVWYRSVRIRELPKEDEHDDR